MAPASPDNFRGLPAEVTALLRKAEACLDRGEPALASAALEEGLALIPDHLLLLHRQAVALHMQSRFGEAASVLRRIVRQCPDDAAIHNNLGSALGAAGDMKGAVAALRRACELSPGRVNYWFNLAKALEITGDVDGAYAALTHLLEQSPGDTDARLLRADLLRILGRISEAAGDLRQVLAGNPDSVEAWVRLANLKSIRFGDDDLAELARLYSSPGLDDEYRASLGFAYGLALEANKRYADAFPIFLKSNAIKRTRVKWDASGFSHLVDDTMHAFAQPLLRAADPRLGQEVIFLFGMPRSGSTLFEQILSAHPRVEGAGEIDDLDAVLSEESERRGMSVSQWAPVATAEDWSRLGGSYLERTRHWRRSRPVFTDKGLDKWRSIGALHAMLPGARLVHCKRDPLETCWSCFKHAFGKNQLPYSYDFRDLARYWSDYDRLMRFWRDRYPDLVFDCSYEDLINEPEAQIRKLLDYCGLSFDGACMEFHEVERNVRTASAGQVRRPLDRGTAQAAHYGALLDPLSEALRDPVRLQ